MSEPAPSVPPARSRRRFSVHLLCYTLLAVVLVYVIIARYGRPMVLDDPIGIDASGRQVRLPSGPGNAQEVRSKIGRASCRERV